MISIPTLVLSAVAFLAILDSAAGACSSNQISCATSDHCLSISNVCYGGTQCTDGSDENPELCKFWTHDSRCSRGQFFCANYYGRCVTITQFCSQCAVEKDSRFCEMVKNGKLQLISKQEGLVLTEEMLKLLHSAVNETTAVSESSCPMLYVRVGDQCVSFFSAAKLPWAEARQFCLSIRGDLLTIKNVEFYEKIIRYMKKSGLTTDYWSGGRYDLDSNAWSWVSSDSPMPLGSPYWALRYSSSCVPRSPPHNDPFSSPAEALPGAPCYNYVQAPAKRVQGWCAAMNYEHYWYFIDEDCQGNRSPLCVFKEDSH